MPDSTLTDLSQILTEIRPGLTLYALILTFAGITFWIGKFFWEYEKKLKDENVQKIANMMARFRELKIEPVVQKQLEQALQKGYIIGVLEIRDAIYNSSVDSEGQITNNLTTYDDLKEQLSYTILTNQHLSATESNATLAFLSSDSGMKFFESVDQLYSQKEALLVNYQKACEHAGLVSYAFLGLFLVLLIGLTDLIAHWGTFSKSLWIFTWITLAIAGIYFFIRMEKCRRNMLRSWEKLEIYGQV